MSICPNCGYQHADNDYAAELSDVRMTGRARDVILRLSQARGSPVHTDSLIDFVYGDEPSGGPINAAAVLANVISQIRPKIRPLGWLIIAENGRGYRLLKEQKPARHKADGAVTTHARAS